MLFSALQLVRISGYLSSGTLCLMEEVSEDRRKAADTLVQNKRSFGTPQSMELECSPDILDILLVRFIN